MDRARPITFSGSFNFPGKVINGLHFSRSPAVTNTRDRHLRYIGSKLIHILPNYFFFSGNLQNSVAFIQIL